MKNTTKLILVSLISFLALSCDEEAIDFPDNYVAFKNTEQGLIGTEGIVELTVSRATDTPISLTITLSPNDVEYGKHFTTEPAATDNTITLTIPQGNTAASLKVSPITGILLSGTESIDFTISNVNAPNLIGINKNHKLSFSKIVSQGSTLTLEGKTAESNYANSVYADLSSNTTKLSDRKLWNIAFTNGTPFRVVLNPSYQTTAAATSTYYECYAC
jgi:hypothetical protein